MARISELGLCDVGDFSLIFSVRFVGNYYVGLVLSWASIRIWEYRVVEISDIPPNSTADGRGVTVISPRTRPILRIVVILKSYPVRLGESSPAHSRNVFRISHSPEIGNRSNCKKAPTGRLGESHRREGAECYLVFALARNWGP